MFADLNKHAVRPSNSLSTLYDHRDPGSELARYVVGSVECFKRLTELEKSSISNRSIKLFTLSSIKLASRTLLGKKQRCDITVEEMKLASKFWNSVCNNMPDWQKAEKREIAPSELRQNFVHAHGIALHALGCPVHALGDLGDVFMALVVCPRGFTVCTSQRKRKRARTTTLMFCQARCCCCCC